MKMSMLMFEETKRDTGVKEQMIGWLDLMAYQPL